MSLVEADAIRAAGGRCGRTASVLHTRRWDDDFRTARETLAGGALGRPRAIKFINWHYNPLRSVDWRDDASTGGGVLWEFGIHCFDQLLQLAGQSPESVFARMRPSPAARADDAFLAIVNFADGLVAHIEVDRLASAPLQTGWTILGEDGSYSQFTHYAPNPDGEVADLPLAPVVPEFDEYYARLVQHVRLGAANPVSVEEARGPIALIEAVRKSARRGEVVRVEGC
jgi:predicted dehydrogenase